ncbi:DUF1269 domain-containing protein [Rhodobacter sp. SY28-1]|uniref:DUF1269 domain-containing protein n=1 Tax=Rhodobacter sp. SY28-1 TaxID=2562317 RepID=UPI0010C0E339|nr:DUF1269 domain-containing protein [Rhodobacter sp. SY28-1]
MSDLILAIYRTQNAAFAAGQALAVFQRAAGTEAEDIVVVTRDASGRVGINQSIDLATGNPLGGGRWGAMIGLLFLDRRKPQPGAKGLAAQLGAVGLDEKFLQEATKALGKGGAAVGMRVRLLGRDRVVEKLTGMPGSPKILWTRLDPDTEDALIDMQGQIPEAALDQPAGHDAF